jgi:tetratricopeptide (TPR) repeat protein
MNSKEALKKEKSAVSNRYVLMGDKETDPEKKEHYYRLALEVEPKNVSALNKMGLLYYHNGKLREAIGFFDAVIDSGKVQNLYPIYFNKSMVLKELKEYEAALNYINKALKFDPQNLQAEVIKKELQDIVDEKYRRQDEREKQAAYSTTFKKEKRYSSWDPPTISILAHMIYYKDWHLYKHRRNFEITVTQREKIASKLASKEFCCGKCNFYRNNGTCKKKKNIQVDTKAICKAFQPGN